jgi:hypothetical protein
MRKVKIGVEGLDLFGQLCKKGHAVAPSQKTEPVVRALRGAGVNIHAGYEAKRGNVVLVLGQPLRSVKRGKTFNEIIYELY